MKIDLTLKLSNEIFNAAKKEEKKVFSGHLGTHFDVMNKQFPLEYTERNGIIFDVSSIRDRQIQSEDVDLSQVKEGMFVGFYTGFIEERAYGSASYFHEHPELSQELIDALLNKKISLIGIDFAGVRRGKEHPVVDQHCANHGVFIIENLCNLKKVIGNALIHCYPLNFEGLSGLPCRVIAEI